MRQQRSGYSDLVAKVFYDAKLDRILLVVLGFNYYLKLGVIAIEFDQTCIAIAQPGIYLSQKEQRLLIYFILFALGSQFTDSFVGIFSNVAG